MSKTYTVTKSRKRPGMYSIKCNGKHFCTPHGRLLHCSSRPHMEQIALDLARDGKDPSGMTSLYSLTCSYLDFTHEQGNESHLINAILSDFEDDKIYRDLTFMATICQKDGAELDIPDNYPANYMKRIGLKVTCVKTGEGMYCTDIDQLKVGLKKELEAFSPFELMCVVYCRVTWGTCLPFMALLRGEFSPSQVAELVEDPNIKLFKQMVEMKDSEF